MVGKQIDAFNCMLLAWKYFDILVVFWNFVLSVHFLDGQESCIGVYFRYLIAAKERTKHLLFEFITFSQIIILGRLEWRSYTVTRILGGETLP